MSETMAEEKPKDKSRGNRRKDKKDKTTQIIKIVMRHLPPTMTEKDFLDQVGPLPENDSYYYCPADWSLGQEATCRAYIDMSLKDIADVLQFRDRFDGYVFVDTKGVEYVAIVEYAPFQCFLKNKARNDDSKVNTIESESHYQEFIQRLADEREEASRMSDVKIDFSFDRRADEKVKSTPLLQYLANKKEKRREEARKRNEEKRKQREEQKQVRLAEQSDATKSKETGGAGGDNKKPAGNNAKRDGKDNAASAAQGNEAAKTSRSKRRTERDQRRREEHEQRKLAQRDKKKPEGQTKTEKDKPSGGKQNKNTKSKDFSKADKDIVILKKDSKPEANDSAELPTTSKAALAEDFKEKTKAENSEVPEAVKKFIHCAGGGQKDRETLAEAQGAVTFQETTAEEAIKAARFRDSEERRIRNKDRPSIAIYQPKARIRIGSDDLPQGTGKDGSDGEASIVEEKSAKKSKRSNRRNKSKPKEVKERQEEARRVSKSSESSNNSNSTNVVK
ncbi:regulator of nonsense transcripts 3A [Drosophila rhopaloa]|uniref:Regulator of nonsense transcripts 3A n=1 Tax=Drosophila rhopaloa TaxID=1041015 RepID=A0A6P4EBS2_DRORH|nr:regulator of nonsense transcripts 3A [Drosophila rhopaloa]